MIEAKTATAIQIRFAIEEGIRLSAIPDEFRWFYPEPKSSKSTKTGKQPTETGDHDIDMTKSARAGSGRPKKARLETGQQSILKFFSKK